VRVEFAVRLSGVIAPTNPKVSTTPWSNRCVVNLAVSVLRCCGDRQRGLSGTGKRVLDLRITLDKLLSGPAFPLNRSRMIKVAWEARYTRDHDRCTTAYWIPDDTHVQLSL
jgi:hypothetical protein